MVIVAFKPGEKEISKYEELDQYDYGQILRIQGLNLPQAVEIHFALQKTGGTSKTRIGITKDGVTDVPIPDSMLENEDETKDYDIYAFIYITDETSGQTEYRIALKVKARPKPEIPGGGDNPDIFHEAVEAVSKAMEAAAESERRAEGWAHGREDLPERAEDNAKYYAGKAHEDAEQTTTDRKEVERLVESVSGIEEQVEKVDGLTKQAQKAATDAGLYKEAAENARKGAETAKTEAETAAGKTAEDKAAVETARGEVLKAQEAVSTDRKAVESIKSGIEQLGGEITGAVGQGMQELGAAKQQAVQAIEQTGTAQKSAVEASGKKAVQSIENIKQTATEAVEIAKSEAVQAVQTEGTTQAGNVSAEGEKQVQAVRGAAQEIIADREQIQMNKEGVAKLKEDIGNKAPAIIKKASGKTIIIEDSSNLPIKALSGTGEIIVTGKNILKIEKYNVFIPFEAKAGTLFTLITNGELSEGGNVRFVDENGEKIWFAINKGETKKTLTIKKNIKGYVNLLSPKEGLKYCFSVGENDKYEEYVEQVITAPVDSEQLKTIHTNYPTTVLTSENEISVEYVADTEAYIGKRIKEENQSLQKQILEIQNALISQKISGGGIIQAKDSAKLPIQNLRVFGKSEQNGVPSLDAPVPIVNVGEKGNVDIKINTGNLFDINTVKKYEVDNTTLSLSVSGNKIIFNSKISTGKEAIVNIINKPDDMLRLLPGKYTLSYNSNKPFGATNGTDTVEMFVCIHNNGNTRFHSTGNKNWTQFEIKEGDRTFLRLDINKSGQSAEFYDIMLNHGESVLPYEPYFNQSLTLSTPNGLPGIKVDSSGNYTDENGQQWICDEINLARGKYVQRIEKYIINSKDKIAIEENAPIGKTILVKIKTSTTANLLLLNNQLAIICNLLKAIDGIYNKVDEIGIGYTDKANFLRMRVPIEAGKTESEIFAYLSNLSEQLVIYYVLKDFVERDLAPEEIRAYKTLHTNYPTTSVSNNADADMELTYTVDTKSYVDTKIAEVSTAIVQKGIE